MNSRQFQSESLVLAPEMAGNRWRENRTAGTINDAMVGATLTGLLLRGFFSNDEKNFLDKIAPSRSLVFVINRETFLHPYNVNLFDPAIVTQAIDQSDTAVFSHLCPLSPGNLQRHKIISGQLNSIPGDPYYLGLFGPEHEISNGEAENRFVETVRIFRKSFAKATKLVERLKDTFIDDSAVLLINRASGRILHATEPARAMLGIDIEELIDQEFHAVKPYLPRLSVGTNMSMKNVEYDDISIALLRYDKNETTGENTANDLDLIVREAKQSIELLPDSARRSLTGGAICPKGKLSHCLELIRQIQTVPENEPGRSNLLDCFDQAVQTVCGGTRSNHLFTVRTAGERFETDLSRKRLISIITCGLLSHLDIETRPFRTDVDIESHGGPSLSITSLAAERTPRLAPNRIWSGFIKSLSESVEITETFSPAMTRFTTKIIFRGIATR